MGVKLVGRALETRDMRIPRMNMMKWMSMNNVRVGKIRATWMET
jgi:hypothetical protein